MSKSRAIIAGSIGAVALLAAGTLPASAAVSGDTTTTFTLDAGTIDIAVAEKAELRNGTSGQPSVSGSLGSVIVTDSRGGRVGWITSATSTEFTDTTGATTSTLVTYDSGEVTSTGDVAVKSSGTKKLSKEATDVMNGFDVTGNNTASWEPTLTVELPPNSLAGSYSGTVVTSVV